MAQWITRLPTEQKIPGSIPGRLGFLFQTKYIFYLQYCTFKHFLIQEYGGTDKKQHKQSQSNNSWRQPSVLGGKETHVSIGIHFHPFFRLHHSTARSKPYDPRSCSRILSIPSIYSSYMKFTTLIVCHIDELLQVFRAIANILEVTNYSFTFYIYCLFSRDFRATLFHTLGISKKLSSHPRSGVATIPATTAQQASTTFFNKFNVKISGSPANCHIV